MLHHLNALQSRFYLQSFKLGHVNDFRQFQLFHTKKSSYCKESNEFNPRKALRSGDGLETKRLKSLNKIKSASSYSLSTFQSSPSIIFIILWYIVKDWVFTEIMHRALDILQLPERYSLQFSNRMISPHRHDSTETTHTTGCRLTRHRCACKLIKYWRCFVTH